MDNQNALGNQLKISNLALVLALREKVSASSVVSSLRKGTKALEDFTSNSQACCQYGLMRSACGAQSSQFDASPSNGLKEYCQYMSELQCKDGISAYVSNGKHPYSTGFLDYAFSSETFIQSSYTPQVTLKKDDYRNKSNIDLDNVESLFIEARQANPSMDSFNENTKVKGSKNSGWPSMNMIQRYASPNLEKKHSQFPLYKEIGQPLFADIGNLTRRQLHGEVLQRIGLRHCSVNENERSDDTSGHLLSSDKWTSSNGSWHENTEELDALMSSDEEENSTGHSPSDVRSASAYGNDVTSTSSKSDFNKCQEFSETASRINSSSCQEICNDGKEFVAATCQGSGSASIEELVGETGQNYDICSDDNSCQRLHVQGTRICNANYDDRVTMEKKDARSSTISISEDERRDSSEQRRQALRSFSACSIAKKKSKKERIKKMIGILRSMFFGEGYIDTAVVLNETVRCVKSLQVKVKALEVKSAAK
eukprot:TRINITY_DN23654_c0_g1_i2.p1 TRINITY_DN23654_c0_g1~~TRINITY_DN23654_c0_g1_i2.p1  ORF type:complete len:482 (-),score=101.09 TRINITY_DN23654_c0_g1_i2:172-1617(-)